MGRESGYSRRPVARHSGAILGIHSSEFVLLVIAILVYLWSPAVPDAGLLQTRLRIQASILAGKFSFLSGLLTTRAELEKTRIERDSARIDLDLARAELRAQSLQVLENDALRSLFLLPRRPGYRYVHGEVVGTSIGHTEARVDVQLAEAVPAGSAVIAPVLSEWTAVGRVVRSAGTRPAIAQVMLLSDPRSRVGVVRSDTPALGVALLVGAGMERLMLDFAMHPQFMKSLSPNLRLLTSPESRFLPGLPAAYMVSRADGSAFTVDESFSPVPLRAYNDLRFVVVLIVEPAEPAPADAQRAGPPR